MNGATMTSYTFLDTAPDTNFRIVGVSDFNKDGQTDILWRNTVTGGTVVWYMNGTALTNYEFLPTVTDTQWQIVTVADFSAELYQTSCGTTGVWTDHRLVHERCDDSELQLCGHGDRHELVIMPGQR